MHDRQRGSTDGGIGVEQRMLFGWIVSGEKRDLLSESKKSPQEVTTIPAYAASAAGAADPSDAKRA